MSNRPPFNFQTQMRALLATTLGALALSLATAAIADKPPDITEAEMALLPAYCVDTQTFKYGAGSSGNASPNAPKWVGMMGEGFWTMHHYCWALINLNRAAKPSVPPNMRQAAREGAMNDMNYVVQHTPPDFILLPEIYTKIGEVQLSLRNPLAAGKSLATARSLKPDYWPPYVAWAEYLWRSGEKAKAREVVAEGLSYAPDSKVLQRLFAEYGGDLATITPRAAPAKPAEAPPQ